MVIARGTDGRGRDPERPCAAADGARRRAPQDRAGRGQRVAGGRRRRVPARDERRGRHARRRPGLEHAELAAEIDVERGPSAGAGRPRSPQPTTTMPRRPDRGGPRHAWRMTRLSAREQAARERLAPTIARMDRLRDRRAPAWRGIRSRLGRQELRPQADGGLAARTGPLASLERASHPGLLHDGGGPASISGRGGVGRNAASRSTRRAPSSVETPYELVRQMRASIVVLGPLLARHGRRPGRHAGRLQHRLAPDRSPPRRARADGRRVLHEHGYLLARGPAARRRDRSRSTTRASAPPRTC